MAVGVGVGDAVGVGVGDGVVPLCTSNDPTSIRCYARAKNRASLVVVRRWSEVGIAGVDGRAAR